MENKFVVLLIVILLSGTAVGVNTFGDDITIPGYFKGKINASYVEGYNNTVPPPVNVSLNLKVNKTELNATVEINLTNATNTLSRSRHDPFTMYNNSDNDMNGKNLTNGTNYSAKIIGGVVLADKYPSLHDAVNASDMNGDNWADYEVYIPAKTYLLTSPLNLTPYSNLTLRGSGGSTILRASASKNPTMGTVIQISTLSGENHRKNRIMDLAIDGNYIDGKLPGHSDESLTGINIGSQDELIISNVEIYNTYAGQLFWTYGNSNKNISKDGIVEKLYSHHQYGRGDNIIFETTTNLRFLDSIINNTGINGTNTAGGAVIIASADSGVASDATILNVKLRNIGGGQYGFMTDSYKSKIRLYFSEVRNFTNHAVYLSGTNYADINSNDLSDSVSVGGSLPAGVAAGILYSNSGNISIIGNHIFNVVNGIHINQAGVNNLFIHFNKIHKFTGRGIYLDERSPGGGSNILVSENSLYDSPGATGFEAGGTIPINYTQITNNNFNINTGVTLSPTIIGAGVSIFNNIGSSPFNFGNHATVRNAFGAWDTYRNTSKSLPNLCVSTAAGTGSWKFENGTVDAWGGC